MKPGEIHNRPDRTATATVDAIRAIVLFPPAGATDAELLAAVRALVRPVPTSHDQGCLGGHYGHCAVSGLFS